MRSASQCRDEQVEITIAIDIDKQSACGMKSRQSNTRSSSHVFKSPASEISVQRVGAGDRAEVKIAQAIAIEVSGGHSGSVHVIVVLDDLAWRQRIGAGNSGVLRRQFSESHRASCL